MVDVILLGLLILLVTAVFTIPNYLLYRRIGESKPWKAFIPILSLEPKLDVAGTGMYVFAFVIIPFIGWFICFCTYVFYMYKFYLIITDSKICAILGLFFEPVINIYLLISGRHKSSKELYLGRYSVTAPKETVDSDNFIAEHLTYFNNDDDY